MKPEQLAFRFLWQIERVVLSALEREGGAWGFAWARFDDEIIEHRKILKVSPYAELAHYRAIIWANRNLSDGYIYDGIVTTLMRGFETHTQQVIDELQRVRLWERRDDGYYIHDFLERGINSTRDHVLEIRRKRAEAGMKGAAVRWRTAGDKSYSDDGKPDDTVLGKLP